MVKWEMLDLLKTYYAYNAWATELVLTSITQLSPDEYTAPGCSGHGSIRDTLAHLLTTQRGWFSWFDHSETVEESMAVHVTPDDVDTYEKASELWKTIQQQTQALLDHLSEDDLTIVWSAKLPSGLAIALPLWKLLLHVANHGTHTRAQIVASIRRLGHEPANLDFFRYSLSA
jgi:uncharacterized damage-inducible protein DinB